MNYLNTNNHKKDCKCPICSRYIDRNILKEFNKKEGYIFIDYFFKKGRTYINFVCPNGHKSFSRIDHWKKGCKCRFWDFLTGNKGRLKRKN